MFQRFILHHPTTRLLPPLTNLPSRRVIENKHFDLDQSMTTFRVTVNAHTYAWMSRRKGEDSISVECLFSIPPCHIWLRHHRSGSDRPSEGAVGRSERAVARAVKSGRRHDPERLHPARDLLHVSVLVQNLDDGVGGARPRPRGLP
jgi:hypothetical protein